jgi:hypothetical protein
MMKKLFLSLAALVYATTLSATYYKAVCTVPVANLFHPSLQERYPEAAPDELEYLYERFPMGVLNNKDCLRLHQLIFHEVVTVIEEWGNEVCIKIKNTFYHNRPWTRQETTYWTLKKYVTPVAQIDDAQQLPTPLNYQDPKTFSPEEQTIFTLKEPFFDSKTDQLYSVRTRFSIIEQNTKTVTVARYHPKDNTMRPLTIAKKYGVLNKQLSPHKSVQSILSLLLKWADSEKTFPCIRGGCSGREYVTPGQYEESSCELPDKKVIGTFERDECQAPYAGFDMPGLIFSACQVYHAPYCAKNTLTASRYLRPMDHKKELIECGDIILTVGYAGIVANLEENLIIEARGHKFNTGTLRVVPLWQTFKGIKSYGQLVERHSKGRTISLLDQNGNSFVTIPFTILKLKSIFEKDVWKKAHSLF